MPRTLLDDSQVHPAIADKIASWHVDIVHIVQAAAQSHAVLVVGMSQNPFCRRAREALAAAGVVFHYLEYGSYFSQWKPRLALKMWTGWPSYPMVFVKGMLVGGATDLRALIDSGELKRLLAQ